MKFLFAGMLFFAVSAFLQVNKVYDARYMQVPPLFPQGRDSCQRFYFIHFKGIDSVLYNTGLRGDTVKYIRVYFSFVVDKYGAIHDARFVKMASTQYAKSVTAKTLQYFSAYEYYNRLVKNMMTQMPSWKPALLNGRAVDCRVSDYLQFWVGYTPPRN
ncbi:MAG: hypothetical protein ABI581_15515 [Sediminibacterium sp.]